MSGRLAFEAAAVTARRVLSMACGLRSFSQLFMGFAYIPMHAGSF